MDMEKGISVIICAYTEQRWEEILSALHSLRMQTRPADEVILVVDHNDALFKRAKASLSDVIVIENTGAPGLSGARNCGIARAQYSLIAFLDDDAIATPAWLQSLQEGLKDPWVAGIGGAVLPVWPEHKASWLPEEFLWVVGCTYRGMPQQKMRIRNPIGANMAFPREVLEAVGGFHHEIGRVGNWPVGCEETDLCIRIHQHKPGSYILYQPEARVFHHIPANRLTWRYFCTRCYCEGLSKAIVTRRVGMKDGLASERSYILKTLPQGMLRGLLDTFSHFDPTGAVRAAAICLGLVMTTIGYLVGILSFQFASSRKSAHVPLAHTHRAPAFPANSMPAYHSLSVASTEGEESL